MEYSKFEWEKSKTFNIYLFLFVLQSLVSSFLYIESLKYTTDEFGFFTLGALWGLGIITFTLINILFIIFSIRKSAPLQIPSLPLIDLFITFLGPFILGLLFGYSNFIVSSYILASLKLIQIIWALYVKFVFLKGKHKSSPSQHVH